MDINDPKWLSNLPIEDPGKEDQKTTYLFSGGGVSLNTIWEWSWVSLGRGHGLVGFLGDGVSTEATPRGGDLGWTFHPNILESLDIQMPGAEVKS